MAGCATRLNTVQVEAKRVCAVTGAKRNKANKVCFSNKKSRTFQQVNLQTKRLFWETEQRWVTIKLSVKALRTIKKNGLDAVAAEYGVDLYSLPYNDVSEARLQWKAANPAQPPMAKNPRAMKNPERLAASKKTPLVAQYCYGKIEYVRSEAQ
eukprot:jgi/Ulvmu1/1525/UM011_0255.1